MARLSLWASSGLRTTISQPHLGEGQFWKPERWLRWWEPRPEGRCVSGPPASPWGRGWEGKSGSHPWLPSSVSDVAPQGPGAPT